MSDRLGSLKAARDILSDRLNQIENEIDAIEDDGIQKLEQRDAAQEVVTSLLSGFVTGEIDEVMDFSEMSFDGLTTTAFEVSLNNGDYYTVSRTAQA